MTRQHLAKLIRLTDELDSELDEIDVDSEKEGYRVEAMFDRLRDVGIILKEWGAELDKKAES